MANRTITRLYDSYDDATVAVRALESAGVPHEDISLIAKSADNPKIADDAATNDAVPGAEIGAGVGAVAGGGAGVLAGLGMLAIPGIGPVVAAGWLAALAVGAISGAAAGGLIGGLAGSGVSTEHAEVYAEGVRRGGTLVSARVPEKDVAHLDALLDRNAVDLAKRRAEYATDGWAAYDASTPVL